MKGGDSMKNKRGLTNRTPLSNAIRNDLWVALDQLTQETDIPKSKLLDKAVELLLESYDKTSEKPD